MVLAEISDRYLCVIYALDYFGSKLKDEDLSSIIKYIREGLLTEEQRAKFCVSLFIKRKIRKSRKRSHILREDLYEAYVRWCTQHNFPFLKRDIFDKEFYAVLKPEIGQITVGESKQPCYVGIEIVCERPFEEY